VLGALTGKIEDVTVGDPLMDLANGIGYSIQADDPR
jgi:hypothetical protein